jgi:uncharacterized lipoprotein
MIKQNKTKLPFILGAALLLSVAACNNSGEKKETVKDEPATTTTPTPAPSVKDSTDTMEKIKGGVSPTPGGG